MLNKSIIGEKQTEKISDRIEKIINYVDINYNGYDVSNQKSSIIKSKTEANINRVLFWLSSKRDDYIRESFKGGVLYDMLGTQLNEESLSEWEFIIRDKFNSEFSNDLEIILLKLSSDKKFKKIVINMMVKDKLENLVFNVGTSVQK